MPIADVQDGLPAIDDRSALNVMWFADRLAFVNVGRSFDFESTRKSFGTVRLPPLLSTPAVVV